MGGRQAVGGGGGGVRTNNDDDGMAMPLSSCSPWHLHFVLTTVKPTVVTGFEMAEVSKPSGKTVVRMSEGREQLPKMVVSDWDVLLFITEAAASAIVTGVAAATATTEEATEVAMAEGERCLGSP